MSVPGRNAPCPCGSGKRYKECHGALAAPADVLDGIGAARRQLDDALAAQQAGRYAEAIALYESVIAQHPRTFDAVHMLGVVHFQRGEFERARALLETALEIMPHDAGAHHNLLLVESALERRAIERVICAEILPRFGRRCIAASALDVRARWRGATPDLIVAKTDMRDSWADVEALAQWLGAAPTFWSYPGTPPPSTLPSVRTLDAGRGVFQMHAIDAERGVFPQHATAIFFGADISPASWYERSPATEVALYCDANDPTLLVDRIPELAREGRTPLHLLFASATIAQRIGLPGYVVEHTTSR